MAGQTCPIRSAAPRSSSDHNEAELRTYRLSGRRWIYNKVELVLRQADGGTASAAVAQAVASNQPLGAAQESAVAFLLQLDNGAKVQAAVYLCHADPEPCSPSAATAAGGEEGGSGSGAEQVAWRLVTRQQCVKGCQGPCLRAIQRFGRVGKRQAAKAAVAGEPEADSATASPNKKDPRFMYLSLDEACTHVGAAAFRLVAGVYNRQGTRLLGTAVSPPIRCLANNDAPTGAARIPLEATLPADWEGWGGSTGGKRRSGAVHRSLNLKRPSSAEEEGPPPPPPGLRTPSTSDKLRLLNRPASSSRLPAPGGTFAQWQLPYPPAVGSAPPRLPLARQLSLPADPPSPMAPLSGFGGGAVGGSSCMGGFGGSGSGGLNESSCELAAAAADPGWLALPTAELAAQLAPSLPVYSESQVAAEREAERQLTLLQQLKASIAATSQPSTSSCGSPYSEGSLQAAIQQAPHGAHPPGMVPAFSLPLPFPSGGSWLWCRSHSLHSLATSDPSLSAATCIGAAAVGATMAAGSSAAAFNGAGRSGGMLGGAAACCHSPLPPQPAAVAELPHGLGSDDLDLGRCGGLDGDLELETMQGLMEEVAHTSGMHVDLGPLLDDVGLMGL